MKSDIWRFLTLFSKHVADSNIDNSLIRKPLVRFYSQKKWLSNQSQSSKDPAGKPDWNRAVSDAEKIVGYPTSYLTLRSLFSDEMSNVAGHMRKLVGTSHPLLKIAKRLVYNGRNNMQTRGLIILLLSKAAAGNLKPEILNKNLSEGDGVSSLQRSLAEITEMIHTAHLIHKGVVTLSPDIYPDGTTLDDMAYGNKMAIISGDYLLANACTYLAALDNPKVVELVSSAISDFTEAEFIGLQDEQDNCLLSLDFTMQDWEQKNFLSAGSLLSKSCEGALMLAGHSEEMQKRAFEFGKNIALAWQVQNDLQPFVDSSRYKVGKPFNLLSAPVVLHVQNAVKSCSNSSVSLKNRETLSNNLEKSPNLSEDVGNSPKNLEKSPETSNYDTLIPKNTQNNSNGDKKMLNDDIIFQIAGQKVGDNVFEELHNVILNGPGVQESKKLGTLYTDKALQILVHSIGPSDARTALENIVHALREY